MISSQPNTKAGALETAWLAAAVQLYQNLPSAALDEEAEEAL